MSFVVSYDHFFPVHHTYFWVRHTDGTARINFFLSLTLPERVTLWLRIIPVKREEEEKSPEKTLCRDLDFNPQTLSPEPSVLSLRPWRTAHLKNLKIASLFNLTAEFPCWYFSPKIKMTGWLQKWSLDRLNHLKRRVSWHPWWKISWSLIKYI